MDARTPDVTYNNTAIGLQLWAGASAEDAKARYVLVLNTADVPTAVDMPWTNAGLQDNDEVVEATEMWSHAPLARLDKLSVLVNATGVAALRLRLK